MSQKRIYLDHAATTPVHPQVLEAMLPFFGESFGNPSSMYLRGRNALEAIEHARDRVAELLGAQPKEIVFTSGGSESDNLAIRGTAFARRRPGERGHLITSAVEHHAVLYTCQQLAKDFGFDVDFVPVDAQGIVDPGDVARAIREDTLLISIMLANNEVGAIQPIADIGALAYERGIAFHTDAVQAAGSLALDVNAVKVDLLSLSGHKFYGPKGIGILFVRSDVKVLPMQTGGGQERNRRAGTEYTAGIVGIAKALELAQGGREACNARLRRLRDRLLDEVPQQVEGARVTGHPTKRLANNASFVVDGVEGEALIL